MRQYNRICSYLVGSLLLTGCDDGRVPTYPATGVVRFSDGRPVQVGTIEFHSKTSGPSPRAKLDQMGRFCLGTFAAGDGAPVGDYRVIIVQSFSAPAIDAGTNGNAEAVHEIASHTDARVDSEYADHRKSTLRATVKSGSENYYEFVVAHPRRKLPKIPATN